jgi:hypothetical protein
MYVDDLLFFITKGYCVTTRNFFKIEQRNYKKSIEEEYRAKFSYKYGYFYPVFLNFRHNNPLFLPYLMLLAS